MEEKKKFEIINKYIPQWMCLSCSEIYTKLFLVSRAVTILTVAVATKGH